MEIKTCEDLDLSLHAPDYKYNCVSVRDDDYSVKSQILTNDFNDVEAWMEDNKMYTIVMLNERKWYKNGSFVKMKLLDWVDLLQCIYDYMDDESRMHMDAVFQM